MLEKLQRIAQAIQFLRLPSIIVGIASLASVIGIVLTSKSHEGDRFLIPSIVMLFWAVNAHTFITTFRAVPGRTPESPGFWARVRSRVFRGWYWAVGVIFLGATAAVVLMTYQLTSFWLSDYGGRSVSRRRSGSAFRPGW